MCKNVCTFDHSLMEMHLVQNSSVSNAAVQITLFMPCRHEMHVVQLQVHREAVTLMPWPLTDMLSVILAKMNSNERT